MPGRTFHVYIMASNSRRLYVGVTGNLTVRVIQHRKGEVTGFARKYQMKRLVYVEEAANALDAIRREKPIKGWIRKKKVDLIKGLNPEWRDLGDFLLGECRDPSLRSG
jgi:putative endonuclease